MVSRLTCPEITTIGCESTYAPNTPFNALIPPGPVVTLTTAGCPLSQRVTLGRYRARLLVVAKGGRQTGRSTKGVVQMHRAASGNHEHIANAAPSQKAGNQIGNSNHALGTIAFSCSIRYFCTDSQSPDSRWSTRQRRSNMSIRRLSSAPIRL